MGKIRAIVVLASISVGLALAGCGRNHSANLTETPMIQGDEVPFANPDPNSPDSDPDPMAGQLPGFPPPIYSDPVAHQISAEGSIEILGNQFEAQAGTNNRAGEGSGGYILIPGGEDDLAFAVYMVEDMAENRPTSFSIEVQAAPLVPVGDEDLPLSYWVGFSDYTQFFWDIHGPFTSNTGMMLNGEQEWERLISETDRFYFAIITAPDPSFIDPVTNPDGLTAVEIIRSTVTTLNVLDTEYEGTAPPYTEIGGIGNTGGGAGAGKGSSALDPATQYIYLTWEHFDDQQMDACEATTYEIYRQGPLGASPLPAEMYIGTMPAAPGGLEYVDPLDNDEDTPDAIPGGTYRYRLRASNNHGSSAKHAAQIEIPLLPPNNVQATDREHLNYVKVTWDTAEGAEGYRIYRDDQETYVGQVGLVTAWDDSIGDYEQHTYWVQSINQYSVSDLSLPDTGRRDAAPVADITADPQAGNGPLSVMLDASGSTDPDGSAIVLYDWDYQSDGTYDRSGPEANISRDFGPGNHTVTARVHDPQGNTDTATVDIDVNAPPIGDLQATPTRGSFPLFVNFDADASFDPDGTIVDFEWDLDGDGSFNFSIEEQDAHGSSYAAYIYSTEGVYTPAVRVTDDQGAMGTASVVIMPDVVAHTWGRGLIERAAAVGEDSRGNVLVAGMVPSAGTGDDDVLLLKFNVQGELIWARSWRTDDPDSVSGMVIDPTGNIFLVGSTGGGGPGLHSDLLLLKFSPIGALEWEAVWGGDLNNDDGAGIVLHPNGSLYVCGSTESHGLDRDSLLLQVSSDGDLGWQFRWDSGNDDWLTGLAVGSDGALYASGIGLYSPSVDRHLSILKAAPGGSLAWAETWFDGDDIASPRIGTAIDGYQRIVAQESTHSLLLAFQPNGAVQWAHRLDPSLTNTLATNIVCDNTGSTYVVGYISNSGWLAEFNALGTLVISDLWNGTQPTSFSSVSLSQFGILLAGNAENNTGIWNTVSVAVEPTTAIQTVRTSDVFVINGSFIDPNGNVGTPIGIIDTGGGLDDALYINLGL